MVLSRPPPPFLKYLLTSNTVNIVKIIIVLFELLRKINFKIISCSPFSESSIYLRKLKYQNSGFLKAATVIPSLTGLLFVLQTEKLKLCA